MLVGVGPLVFLHDQSRLIVAPLTGAAVAELGSWAGRRRGWGAPTRLRVVAATTAAATWAASVVALWLTGGVAWSAHLIGGGLVVAATAGLVVGVLATLPDAVDVASAEPRTTQP